MTTNHLRGPLGLPIAPNGLQAVGYRKDGRPIWPIAGADGTETITRSPMLERLYGERNDIVSFIDRTVNGANEAARDLSPSESETLTKSRQRMQELDAQITPLEEFEKDKARGAAATAAYRPGQTGTGDQSGAVAPVA
ncbi:MAG TPA: hypothetical protein VIQ30_15685, partial [Pseudonocardia sp.]